MLLLINYVSHISIYRIFNYNKTYIRI